MSRCRSRHTGSALGNFVGYHIAAPTARWAATYRLLLERYPDFHEDLNVSHFLIFKTKRQG
ncbi:UNVERIFIED_CONTAM: hypothetical protein ABIC26_000495 [Paenibacillus sp. PvR008]